jgi:hypothetical protein
MKQSMISRYENANYSSWSVNTLKKLAEAFDVCLDVKFRSFGELVTAVDGFSRESLEVPKFSDDPFFNETPSIAAENLTPSFGQWPLNVGVAQSTLNNLVFTGEQYTTINPGSGEWWERLSRPAGLNLQNSLLSNMNQNPPDIPRLTSELNQKHGLAA